MMVSVKEIFSSRSFGGYQKIFEHQSKELGCLMSFSVYLPPQTINKKVPVIYWLSGLTCTEKNFTEKAGVQRYASENGIIIVACDTSPRGLGIPGEDDSWDFGTGAGFYVDASQKPWSTNYRMYSYVTKELPDLINANFPTVPEIQSIMGHSMGGHGALICALKNPGKYRSVSAFSPICNPSQCQWGKKAFGAYLGSAESSDWSNWDATELVKKYSGPSLEILIDQGKEDKFLKESQLLPENFIAACKNAQVPVVLNMHEGYDHSYYFIASFIGQHIQHHACCMSR